MSARSSTRNARRAPAASPAAQLDHEVVIIGAGFSGIGAGIKLDEAGFSDFVILDRNERVGGVWHANTYPGIAVDIPSLSYSFSFAQNPAWSRVFAPGAELKEYAERCVDAYDLRSRLRLGTTVTGATFDEKNDRWCLTTSGGEPLRARFLVSAAGVLTQPKDPDIPGLERFAGHRMHTARWDHGHSLAGKRVAIIGTGASALQVIPVIAKEVAHLTVFQRTPIWVLPKFDEPIPKELQRAFERVPLLQSSARLVSQAVVELAFVIAAHYHRYVPVANVYERMALDHLERQVKDPVLRDKLTPRYGFGCKRPSISNTYLRAFNRPNVSLVTDPIVEIVENGLRTADDRLHEVDTLICATGFKVFESGNMPAFPVTGLGGRDLETFWDEHRYQAYEGVTVPGFPNLFSILGPNGYNGASFFQLIEMQSRHIVRCLSRARRDGATRIEVRREANDRYFRQMKSRSRNQVFFASDCAKANSYYFDRHGDVPFRPATSVEAQLRSMTFPLDDYRFERFTSPRLAVEKKRVSPADVAKAVAVLRGIGDDPNRTDLVGEFIASLTGASFGELFEKVWSDPVGRRILEEGRDLRAALSDRAALASMPAGSLGRTYFEWTQARDFDAEGIADVITQVPRDLHGPAEVMAARVVDMHDLWHVLNGWDSDIHGEIHLLGYSYAQLGSLAWLLLALLGNGGLALLGRYDGTLYLADAIRRGRKAALLAAVEWETMLPLPLDEVRLRLGVEPPTPYRKLPMAEFERRRRKSPGWGVLRSVLAS